MRTLFNMFREGFHISPRRRSAAKANSTAGFTLLLAALVASITLALGASVFAIAQKQITLSSLGRDSQYAFYAADTGAECALYWDERYSYFGVVAPTDPAATNPTCAGTPLNLTMTPARPFANPSSYTMTFQFDVTNSARNYCTVVSVIKCQGTFTNETCTPIGNQIFTIIRGDGFSSNCASKDSNSRTLQRSVEIHY